MVEGCPLEAQVEEDLDDYFTNPELEGIKLGLCYEHLRDFVLSVMKHGDST